MVRNFLTAAACLAIGATTIGANSCASPSSPSTSSASSSSGTTTTSSSVVTIRTNAGTTYRVTGSSFRFIAFDGQSTDSAQNFRLPDCTLRSYRFTDYSSISYAGERSGCNYSRPSTVLNINGTVVWPSQTLNGVRGVDASDGSTRSVSWSNLSSVTFP